MTKFKQFKLFFDRGKTFQSTPPRRWRRSNICQNHDRFLFQSTPLWRWWLMLFNIFCPPIIFQSTPPRRWWHMETYLILSSSIFQSTPPRRWWRILQDLGCGIYWDFNPHHREGGDMLCIRQQKNFQNFNPHHREGGDAAVRGAAASR